MVTHRIPFMRGECYSILAALCIAAGLGSQGGFAAAHESEVESNWRDDSVTQLWIHGAGRIPEQAAELGAQGLRFIHNLRAGPPQSAEAILARYADAGVGLCLTLRWADSAEQSAISKTDTPPSAEESAAAIADLLVVLNSESPGAWRGGSGSSSITSTWEDLVRLTPSTMTRCSSSPRTRPGGFDRKRLTFASAVLL